MKGKRLALVIAALTLCAEAEALFACPSGSSCLVAMAEIPRRAALAETDAVSPETTPRRPHFDLKSATEIIVTRSANRLALPVATEAEVRAADARRSKMETPWIWKRVKTFAYAHLPRHRTKRFEAVWSPVIVSGPQDKTPGVGVGGRF
jgi:hypothetical protein